MWSQIFYKEIDYIRNHKLDSVEINPKYDKFTNHMISWQLNFLKEFNIYQFKFQYLDTLKLPNKTSILGRFLFYINKGDYFFYKYKLKNLEAKEYYQKALQIAQEINSKQLICEALKKLLDINRYSYLDGNITYTYYTGMYKDNIYDELEKYNLMNYNLSFSFQYIHSDKWNKDSEKKLIEFTKHSENFLFNAKTLQLISSYYHAINDNPKAIKYSLDALKNINKIKYNFNSSLKKIIQISLTRYYIFNNNKNKSQKIVNNIDTLINNKLEQKYKRYPYFYQSYLDSINKNYKSAFLNLNKYVELTETQGKEDNIKEFKELETKYQTAEKEKQILISEQKRKQNSNFLIGSLLFIILGGTIAIVTVQSSKRKRKLAEQQNELEYQKNLTLLKEQELTSINAMVHGQEKERKRIAEDLHDNLGSVLATLKLHFENLKINREKKKIDQNQLFDKTESLIDEAYLKVRRIAHAKNAGVIANQGLLVAIKMMAEKISSADKIQIEVIDFGLNKRLENNLEISVFRIVQELITNTIKHAEAQNTTINISQFENILNIIIEDDGKGFDINKVDLKDGMGIQSIKTRIQHLKGTFEVDSTLNKGTSIIINIPVE